MIVVLTAVMILSGLVLATVSGALQPLIAANQEQALAESLESIFDDAADPEFTALDTDDIWRASAGGRQIGYAARVEATGYGGPIQLILGISPGLDRILGIAVVESVETPGLGARIQEEEFQNQFEGLSVGEPITAVKNEPADTEENEIEAISGATISTNAVVNAVNAAVPDILSTIETQEEG
jgi:electron transport complex protein RnfG